MHLSTVFGTTSDGRKVFFDLSLRGYVIQSDQGYTRLSTWMLIFTGLTMPIVYLMVGLSGLHSLLLLAAWCAIYQLGARCVLRSMKPPALKLSRCDSFAVQARSQSSDSFLGNICFGGILLGAALYMVSNPDHRAVGLAALVLFGLVTVRNVAMYRFCIADRRAALRLLAAAKEEGCTEAMLQAHGFQQSLITRLLRDRVAVKWTRPINDDGRSVEAARVWITQSGRNELAELG